MNKEEMKNTKEKTQEELNSLLNKVASVARISVTEKIDSLLSEDETDLKIQLALQSYKNLYQELINICKKHEYSIGGFDAKL